MVVGKAPALIFVVRHGARLDAADKEWHLTSPTPYDPPLTYGGWTQSRAVGARIASILLAREATHLNEEVLARSSETNTSPSLTTQARTSKRKKHRVILHSSPFMRCTQTSIAIAAGMSQFHGLQNELRAQLKSDQARSPPRTRPTKRKEPGLETIADDDQIPAELAPLQTLPVQPLPKTKLRLDAFLGEWFSPEYYEHITHPPNSILMLASAKAELLHRGEALEGVTEPTDESPKPKFFPGGWGSPIAQPGTPEIEPKRKELELPELDGLTILMSPTRSRATTMGSPFDQHRQAATISRTTIGGYSPPTPRYAILPSDPIPRGYTAHAREACVDVDYAWDSTRPPQNWGDGGEYGEEWSSMHKRFRSGISRMVGWYRIHHESALQSHGHKRALHPVPEDESDEDCDIDTVLVLVTHGAGCNALIGALTSQPVLMDVAMASLTMAIRKDLLQESKEATQSPGAASRHFSSGEQPLSQEYSVLLTASVDHLRAGTNTLSIPILQNPSLAFESLFSNPSLQRQNTLPYSPTPRYKMNRSTMITSSPIDQSPQEITHSAGPRYGGAQRSSSAAARSGGSDSPALWNELGPRLISEGISADGTKVAQDEDSAIGKTRLSRINSGQVLDLENPGYQSRSSSSESEPSVPTQMKISGLWPAPEAGNLVRSSTGLWSARITSNIPSGPPSGIPLEVSERSAAAKRRWTLDENRGE